MNPQISYATASASFQAGNYTQALVTINRLLDIQRDAKTYALLGKTLVQLGFGTEAATAYALAAECGDEDSQEYLVESIRLQFAAGNKDEALALGNKLVTRSQVDPEIGFIIASILYERGELKLAEVYKDGLMKSRKLEHVQLGARIALHTWDVFRAADIETARLLLSRLPDNNRVRLTYLTFCREHNKFDAVEREQRIIEKAIAKGDTAFLRTDLPFYNIHWSANERINRLAQDNTPKMPEGITDIRRSMPHNWGRKIRVGYVSADFFDVHATMKLIRRVLETHDRERFEITLFCHTKPDMVAVNKADRSAWGDIVTIYEMSDRQVVEEIRRREIDILVDLKGHTANSRTSIFNLAAAPIQVTWLGFPGSVVNVDLDYTIGDPIVLPMSSAPFYREKFCRLPEVYQPNDPFNRPLPHRTSRQAAGLPEDAFVFASFNANRKITPEVIKTWTKILKRTPKSVIWIIHHSDESRNSIRDKLVRGGIAASRVFFTRKLEYDLHINRIPTADLGLDTFPVNGHTTTSEQLWAGLPVVAVKGTNFASRVSESLLKAMGLPELVTDTVGEYIEKAVHLYNHPDELQSLKDKIDRNRFIAPLFDADRLRQHLEIAYQTMVDRAKAGLAPDHFDVAALPPRTEPFMSR